ncbi:TetR/AcrR family transcriptional regulator [Streptosporangium sp. NPDC087985]|uniref:TetR/AcrR family transcriptional regulator n=1 Tax=Streptosporangium sp. NPDC087985 TaxID=3366196 RepID=UPI003806A9F1
MTSADGGQRELILRVATRLFAALGYDATSLGQIAEAAGLGLDTAARQAGTKRELYLAVMERAYLAERSALERTIGGVQAASPEQAAGLLHRITDNYLDLCVAHPEVPALWIHRWMSDASDVTEVEQRYTQPLIKLVEGAFAPAVAAGHIGPDVDVTYLLWSLIWCVDGFSQGGVLGADGSRVRTNDPEALRRFRIHIHRLIHRTAGLPGDPP